MTHLAPELSPKWRALEAIINCSAELYSTKFTVNGDGIICETPEGDDKIEAHRHFIGKRWIKFVERKSYEKRTDMVVTGRTRSESSRTRHALGWPRLVGIQFQGLN